MSCQLSPRRAHSLKGECVGVENNPSPHSQILRQMFGEKVRICCLTLTLGPVTTPVEYGVSGRSDSHIVSISGSRP